MPERPGSLGISIVGQVPCLVEDDLVELEPVLPKEEVGLIETVFSQQRGRGVVLQRGVCHGLEGAEVGAVETNFAIELARRFEDLVIRLVGGTDYELGSLSCTGVGLLLDEPVGPAHAIQEVAAEVFLAGDSRQPGRIGGFQVQGDPIRQLDSSLHAAHICPGQDLKVYIATEVVSKADDFRGDDHPFHHAVGAPADAGAKEEPLDEPSATESLEEPG